MNINMGIACLFWGVVGHLTHQVCVDNHHTSYIIPNFPLLTSLRFFSAKRVAVTPQQSKMKMAVFKCMYKRKIHAIDIKQSKLYSFQKSFYH